MIRSLAELLAPADEAFFLRHFRDKEQFLLRAEKPGRAESMLPWGEIDRLFAASAPSHDRLRVMLNANTAEPRMYREGYVGPIRPDALLGLASQGATLVQNGINDHVPAIDALVTSMERRLGCDVWANCYLSFGEFSGFLTHCDTHDVMILQVWGAKRWRTYGTPVPHPIDGMRPPKPETHLWEDVLRSGDLLYIPRGEFHAAVPEDHPSVHLTIGLMPSRGMNFVQWLAERAGEDALFRADLQRPDGSDGSVADEAGIKRALKALIDESSIGDFLAAADRKKPVRRVAAFGAPARMTAQTVFVSALRRRLDLEVGDDEELEIEIGGSLVRLTAMARRALGAITEQDRMTLADVATTLDQRPDDQDLIDGLSELTRKALIAIED